jgi:hypothetical protein
MATMRKMRLRTSTVSSSRLGGSDLGRRLATSSGPS